MESMVKQKLDEVKPRVRLFGLDYDGTVYDGKEYKLSEVLLLTEKILSHDISVAFITARAASALKALVPPIQDLLKAKDFSATVFIGGGNGTILYEVKKDSLVEIYNHGLSLEEINRAVTVWRETYKKYNIIEDEFNSAGIVTFQNFLAEDWQNYIDAEILNICRNYNGKIFTETAKVTFVLPSDKGRRNQLIGDVGELLGEEYAVVAGDDKFAHITKRLAEDNKAMAIKKLLEYLELDSKQVATFGDMPMDNDAGLLSFPFSFTNSEELVKIKAKLDTPPYILADDSLPSIARVYKAIDYLISN